MQEKKGKIHPQQAGGRNIYIYLKINEIRNKNKISEMSCLIKSIKLANSNAGKKLFSMISVFKCV